MIEHHRDDGKACAGRQGQGCSGTWGEQASAPRREARPALLAEVMGALAVRRGSLARRSLFTRSCGAGSLPVRRRPREPDCENCSIKHHPMTRIISTPSL